LTYFTHFVIKFLGEPILRYFNLCFAVCFHCFETFFELLLSFSFYLFDRVL